MESKEKSPEPSLAAGPSGGRQPLPELLSTEDMCVIFGVSKTTLMRWRTEKGLPHIRLGHKTYYLESTVSEWLKSQKSVVDLS